MALGRDADDEVDPNHVAGWIDEVAVYDTALSADRVRAHADAG